LAYGLVSSGALVRTLGPLAAPSLAFPLLVASGVLWSGAFAIFLAVHAPMLLRPRVDGRPG
ncbi:MAG TPA: NnrS family protein, partial [Candidatus Thermoplasmatota archaeon]